MNWIDAIPALVMTAKMTACALVLVGAGLAIEWLNREPWQR